MKMVNLVADAVSQLRETRDWSQEELANRLQLAGWAISRSNLSKIENCTLYVPEFRLFYLAHVFDLASPVELLPAIDPRKPVHESIMRLIHNEKRGLVAESPDEDIRDSILLLKSKKLF